jgi:hypothetical protein
MSALMQPPPAVQISAAHASVGLEVSHLRVEYDGFVAVADTSFVANPAPANLPCCALSAGWRLKNRAQWL